MAGRELYCPRPSQMEWGAEAEIHTVHAWAHAIFCLLLKHLIISIFPITLEDDRGNRLSSLSLSFSVYVSGIEQDLPHSIVARIE